jgi:GTP-binding protein
MADIALPRVLDAQFVAGAQRFEQLPPAQHIEVAFAGRSNVGKSSLMNALLERQRLVRTSSTPGCTRQVSLFEITTRDGGKQTWVDLPGYGYARRSHSEKDSWAELVEGYLMERSALGVVLVLADVRRGLQPEEDDLLKMLQEPARVARAPLHVLLVATKFDKVPASQRKVTLERLPRRWPGVWSPFSTELKETHGPLWSRLMAALASGQPSA